MTKTLLVATGNPGKLREYSEIFGVLGLTFVTPAQAGLANFEVDEPYATFVENAVHKARAYAEQADLPVIADDSGLCIDALDGRPGVYSARYAGPGASDDDRTRIVLDELAGVPDAARTAQFVCVSAAALPGGPVETAEGVVRGMIARTPGRRITGFGYDPIFIPEGYEVVFSEIPAAEKHAISHRGRAAAALLPALRRLLEQV
jgi:XTP/dITP diphosphohydrolase